MSLIDVRDNGKDGFNLGSIDRGRTEELHCPSFIAEGEAGDFGSVSLVDMGFDDKRLREARRSYTGVVPPISIEVLEKSFTCSEASKGPLANPG